MFPYLIPSNAFASSALKGLAELLVAVKAHTTGIGALSSDQQLWAASLAKKALDLSKQMEDGVEQFGAIGNGTERRYVYEADGFGNILQMDDPNLPSLLGLPLTGYVDSSDPTYQATRKWVLSDRNPFYFSAAVKNETAGVTIAGLGSPHTGVGRVWPMSMITRAMTSTDVDEVKDCLAMLLATGTLMSLFFT